VQELGALNVTRSMTADIKNLGFTINLHNGDLAYAECACLATLISPSFPSRPVTFSLVTPSLADSDPVPFPSPTCPKPSMCRS